MNVTLISSCLVQPAEPTWNGCMPLTEFDQTDVITHSSVFYFYRPSKIWLTPKDKMLTTLKTSLSRALVHFYPVAGRLCWLDGARLELNCNAKGVRLIEASCDAILDDVLGDFTQSPNFDHRLIPQMNYLVYHIEEIPLFLVQLTKFQCGGVILCLNISHALVDGYSSFHFFFEWTQLARGEPLGAAPFLDRRALRAGEPPSSPQPPAHHVQFINKMPLLIGQSSTERERAKETSVALLRMSNSQVEMLKNEANEARKQLDGTTRAYSRYEALAAYIWKCVTKSRNHVPEQPTGVLVCVEIRRRVRPLLPDNFFGNAVVDVIATSCSGDLITRPLGYAAGRIREAVDAVTSEYVHSTIDFLKNLKDFSSLQDIHALTTNKQGNFTGNPNLAVVSWNFPPWRGLDFGWGREFFMAPGRFDCDGDSVILPEYSDGNGVVVAVCLQSACMEDFKKFFYENIQTSTFRSSL